MATHNVAALSQIPSALAAGDVVVLEAGRTFSGSLSVKSGVTYKSSPTNRAIVTGGIVTNNANDVTVEGIDFNGNGPGGYGAYYGAGWGWIVRKCRFRNMGDGERGGLYWHKGGGNLIIEDNVFEGSIAGEPIWASYAENVKVLRNTIGGASGWSTDGVQLHQCKGLIEVDDNTVDMRGSDTGKGGIIIQNQTVPVGGSSNFVRRNKVFGGKFGIASDANDIKILNNEIREALGANWASGILLAREWAVTNIEIAGNKVVNCFNGVYCDRADRNNIDIHDNWFEGLDADEGYALRSTIVTGKWRNNRVVTPTSVQLWSQQPGLELSGNEYVPGMWFAIVQTWVDGLPKWKALSGREANSKETTTFTPLPGAVTPPPTPTPEPTPTPTPPSGPTQAEVDALKAEVTALKAQVATLTAQLATATNEKNAANSKIAAAKTALG